MKNLVLILISIISMLFINCSSDRYDLGKLEITTRQNNMTYCQYKITGVDDDCPDPYYNNGDTVCIECCITRVDDDGDPNPWPPKVLTNNNCPRDIEFTSSDGTCVYEATRISQDCGNCPNTSRGEYKCPNP